MAKKPANFEWLGFTSEQIRWLNHLDFLGNNAWDRNSQSNEVMPRLMGTLREAGLSMEQIKQAMADIGYGKEALHQLERWESKRTTGNFGR